MQLAHTIAISVFELPTVGSHEWACGLGIDHELKRYGLVIYNRKQTSVTQLLGSGYPLD